MPSYMHEDEPLPPRTTPQGTQAEGVVHGVEERDVDFRALIKWFVGLAIAVAIIMPLVYGSYRVVERFVAREDRLPSPIFAEQWQVPPPRVLPNPIDAPPDKVTPLPQPLRGPQAYLADERRAENARLDQLGLRDPQTGLPALPERAVQAVLAESAGGTPASRAGGTPALPAINALNHPIPSGYSGGLRWEDRLR